MFSIQGPSLCKTSTENFKIENASAVEPAEMAEAVSVDEHFGRDVTTITFKKHRTRAHGNSFSEYQIFSVAPQKDLSV